MIVVHIGLKKAGSSTLQHFLHDNELALRAAASVDYPQVGRLQRIAHHNLASEIQERNLFDSSYGTISELSDYWRDSGHRTMILSSEMFEDAAVAQIKRMRDVLGKAKKAEEFRIVLILRDLTDLMRSSYAQKIKYGTRKYDFDAFFSERIKEERVHYYKTAKRWADVFGWESMRVRVLDKQHLVDGNLVSEFLNLCGIDVDEIGSGLSAGENVSNIAPGWKVVEALRALFDERYKAYTACAFGRIERTHRRKAANRAIIVGDKYGWNADKGQYLTTYQAQRCLDIYRNNVEALNTHLSNQLPFPADLSSRGFRERRFLPDVSAIEARELDRFYGDLQSELVRSRKDA